MSGQPKSEPKPQRRLATGKSSSERSTVESAGARRLLIPGASSHTLRHAEQQFLVLLIHSCQCLRKCLKYAALLATGVSELLTLAINKSALATTLTHKPDFVTVPDCCDRAIVLFALSVVPAVEVLQGGR